MALNPFGANKGFTKRFSTYLICVNSLVHCPRRHEEINRSCGEVCRKLVQFTKLLHVVDNRVVFSGVFLCLIENGGYLAKNKGE